MKDRHSRPTYILDKDSYHRHQPLRGLLCDSLCLETCELDVEACLSHRWHERSSAHLAINEHNVAQTLYGQQLVRLERESFHHLRIGRDDTPPI